jgi:glycosyltransferase involved in cell wall biosynthesis
MSTSRERVAFFLPGLYEGGAERVVLNLAEGIAARGYQVDLVLARAEGPFMAQIPDSVRLVDLKAARVMRSVPALARYLRQERPTAMLSALFTNIVALWARRFVGPAPRLVICEHNILSAVVKNQDDPRWQWYPRLAGWFYPWADAVVAVSKSVADDLARTTKIPRDRIQVIYNPVVTSDLRERSQAQLDHPWFGVGEPPVIVSIGRLTSQKAFDVLIQAFSHVRRHRLARLLILGEGEQRQGLQALVRELGLEQDVSLCGFVPNPYPYMARAALFVLASRWEGLPTVLIEALYFGTPMVATDCPGGTREVLQDGQYGQLVPVDSPLALAEAIEASLDCQRPQPSPQLWQPFASDCVVERYLSLLFGV